MNFPEPAGQVWNEYGEVLMKYLVHLSQDAEVPRAWWIGGGTILAARWEHRQSRDIDILISEKTKGNGAEEALKSIATELRHRGAVVDLEIPHGWMHARHQDPGGAERQRGIDIWVKEPRLRAEVEVERIGNYNLPTLPTSQILYGKLLRGTGEIARDAYDIAHAHGKDPAALESAVNSVSWTLQRRSEILWHTGAAAIDREKNAIVAPDGRPAHDQEGCGRRAAAAIREARWSEVQITTRNGRLHVLTRNAGGERRDWTGSRGTPLEGCLGKLMRIGIYNHVLENYDDAEWGHRDFVEAVVHSMRSRTDDRILHTRTALAAAVQGPPEARMTAEIGDIEPAAGT